MTVASSSRTSSRSSSKPTGERKELPAMTWTTATFSFPPPISHPVRAPVLPQKRSKSRESSSPSSTNTSRMINNLPGFDDFAELVISSERAIPRLTLTTSHDPSPRTTRSRRTHPQRSTPSEPKPTVPTVPAQTASLPWTKDDDDAGRVTFIFGRFRPSIVRRSAPPSTLITPDTQIRSQDFVNIPSPQEQPSTQS
ncbi:hypothetical protein ACGC1H_005918 [Rhizoctonia solani]